ncbi:MAG: hypothetical protein M1833_004289 [Piccolia ochrophora]|nr:MAG: hypothetical protein M1833_004289 [Piccolia ochrophora]
MSSSSSGIPAHRAEQGGSSSAGDLSLQAQVGDDGDEDNAGPAILSEPHHLLTEESLQRNLDDSISFKRKQKTPATFPFPKFLASPLGTSRQASPSPAQTPSRLNTSRNSSSVNLVEHQRHGSTQVPAPNGASQTMDSKDGGPLDWYTEGPGRRVGYDDMTAIDWIFEYTKERQRLRVLYSSATGVLGYAQQLLDASQIWWVLIGTGIATGAVAAFIDVASDWLGDLKGGYCTSGSGGGNFYLNRAFCCRGFEGESWPFSVDGYVQAWSQCLDWTTWSKALHIRNSGGAYIVEYIIFILYSVLFAACAGILVKTYAVYARHSGIPEIKTVLGGFVIRRFLGTWTLIIKSLGLCLAVASGLWLGKEGPLVHVACCCANVLMKLFGSISNNEARKREALSAAAAAGISVAFGSPIGGVLFSLEQLSYYFPDKTMWQSFVCAMVAAFTLQGFNPFRTGKLVLYQVTYRTSWHGFEMVPYALLGIMGGLYGGLFIKLNMKISAWRKSTKPIGGPVTEVVIVAIITAVVNFPNVFMRAQSSELVYSLFAECSDITDDEFGLCKTGAATAGPILLLLLAAVLGFLLASVTFGLQIPAGIILPSMAIGALYGRALGIIVEVWQNNHPNALIFAACEPDVPCVTPGTYAIIGAASALGGVTRMTVSIVVIMFELTGALDYVLPIMIAVMLSKWVGDAQGKRGIYESWIHFKEYPFLDNRDEAPIADVPASQIMTRIEDLVVLTATGHTIATLNTLLATQPHRGFPVVADARDALLLGYISRNELSFALNAALSPARNLAPSAEAYFTHHPHADVRSTLDLRPWMDQTPITLSSRSSLPLTANLFQKLGLRYVLFCDRGVLQGLLTKKDVWYVLNGAEEGRTGVGAGALREEGRGEERGLLAERDGEESGSVEFER